MAENQDVIELQTVQSQTAQSDENYKQLSGLFKVSFAGTHDVGKTSLLRRILKRGFSDVKQPIALRSGISSWPQFILHEVHEHQLAITPFVFWDTADMERYNQDEVMPYLHHRGSHFILLIYSADDKESLYELLLIVQDLERYGHVPSAKLILVRNKIDLPVGEHGVPEEKEKEFLDDIKLRWDVLGNFWTSAKTNEGVENLLKELGKHSLKIFENRRQTEDCNNPRLDINSNKPKKSGFSCLGQ